MSNRPPFSSPSTRERRRRAAAPAFGPAEFDGTPAAARSSGARRLALQGISPSPDPAAAEAKVSGPSFRPRLRRFIVHVDIDAFFAAVEVLLNPALKGKPLIVGGLPHERGVASTCSYEARRYGVHSGMALRTAFKLCPQGVFVRGNYQVYQSFSEKFFDVLRRYTPDVEATSIDEAYLDFTRCRRLYASFPAVARDLKAQVERETGLSVSVGVAPNKILAKLATGRAKPAGYFEIEPGREEEFLRDVEIDRLPGIGPKTQVVMRMLNIKKIGDLWGMSESALHSIFGLGGDEIYLQSRGLDNRSLVTEADPKSVSRETTFLQDLWDSRLLLAHVAYLCDRLTLALREGRYYAHVIEVKVRYADFRTEVRRRLLVVPRREMTDVYRIAQELFLGLWGGSRLPLRLVGVKASDLTRVRPLSLFEPYSDRQERLGTAVDQVREKFGFGSVLTIREKMLDEVYPKDRDRGFVLKTASLTR
ncbi:MAG: DNA polymerase IV [Candidatus Aminicenantes bacterium]|nr:DNA polymerase IV [Candidatus Aminicenantes bacterium]